MRMLQPSLDRCRREQWKVRLGFVIIEFSRRVGWAYLSLKKHVCIHLHSFLCIILATVYSFRGYVRWMEEALLRCVYVAFWNMTSRRRCTCMIQKERES